MKKEFKALPQTRKRCFELGMKEERKRILKLIDIFIKKARDKPIYDLETEFEELKLEIEKKIK